MGPSLQAIISEACGRQANAAEHVPSRRMLLKSVGAAEKARPMSSRSHENACPAVFNDLGQTAAPDILGAPELGRVMN